MVCHVCPIFGLYYLHYLESAEPEKGETETQGSGGGCERCTYPLVSFILIVIIFAITSVHCSFPAWLGYPALFVLLPAVFCGVFYLLWQDASLRGADAWALIFISFCIPTFPFTPLLGNTPLGFLAFSVLINALLLNLVAPIGIFALNIIGVTVPH